jgi:replicative DNA helicase
MDYPTAHDEEALCLSALMRCGGGLRKRAKRALKPEMFDRYRDLAHVVLATDGRPDEDTVAARYDGDKLEEVTSLRPVPKNLFSGRGDKPGYVEQVRQAYGSCRTLEKLYDLAAGVTESDYASVIERAQQDLTDVSAELDRGGGPSMTTLCKGVLQDLEDEQGQTVTGIPSGFPLLDDKTKGWQDGDLIIPFGSTSMGKTSLSLCFALNAAKEGYNAVIHSLEMPAKQLTRRLIQMEARVDLRQTTIPEREMDRVVEASAKLSGLPLIVREASALDPLTHRSRLRHIEHNRGIDLAVVDYLQEMRSSDWTETKHDEVHAVASGLKDTAIELDIPVICPSQTSRAPDNRSGSKRPNLSDLREAGEEPADTALGIYRPEYYGITHDDAGEPTEGKAEITVAKQRNGEAGAMISLAFVEEHAAFEPLGKRSAPAQANARGDGAPATEDDAPF